MDAIEQQIHEYRYEATDGAKPRIVEELSWTEDERILPFLLEILADIDEPEAARVEAARALTAEIDVMRDDVLDVLRAVIERDDDDVDVREQALLAAALVRGDALDA